MASKDKRENGSAMDDTEFEKLLDEMDELGRQADVLREKVNHLIDEMRENDVVEDAEAEGDAGEAAANETRRIEDAGANHESGDVVEDEDNESDGEARIEESSDETSGEDVDEGGNSNGEIGLVQEETEGNGFTRPEDPAEDSTSS